MRLYRGSRRVLSSGEPAPQTPDEKRMWSAFRSFKAEITGDKGERRVRDALDALGVPALHDVILRDRLGLTQIDHIARASDAIVVIETKNYAGSIEGDVRAPTWSQHFEGKPDEHTLPNPCRQNFRHLRAVESLVGDRAVLVRACVVMVGSAAVDAGLQSAVVPFTDLARQVVNTLSPPQQWLDRAWTKLESAAAASPSCREAHRAQIAARRARS